MADGAGGVLRGRRPGVLVNNAGVLASGPSWRMVDVNVTGVLSGCTEGHRYLRRSERGLLLNLCSASSPYGQPTLATYGATKAAVKSVTEALDIEWRAERIRVRSLLPLFVDTEMVTRDGRGIASIASLGVRLMAVVHERRRLLGSPHRPVGRQTRVMAAASAVTPDWANRLVVKRLAG